MVSCQKGPTRHAYAWQIGPFWQDTLDKKSDIVSILHTNMHVGVCKEKNAMSPIAMCTK